MIVGSLLCFKSPAKIKDGGTLIESASIDVMNNAVSQLTIASQSAITFNVTPNDGEVANFAVEITANISSTLTVTKTVDSTVTTLHYSEAGGNTLESGKFYQVTCVGNCWTLAEFVDPNAQRSVVIDETREVSEEVEEPVEDEPSETNEGDER